MKTKITAMLVLSGMLTFAQKALGNGGGACNEVVHLRNLLNLREKQYIR